MSQIGDATYYAPKHAVVGYAESPSIIHGDDGIMVSVTCPPYLAIPMLGHAAGNGINHFQPALLSQLLCGIQYIGAEPAYQDNGSLTTGFCKEM